MESLTIKSVDTSIDRSKQLESAPPKISALCSRKFVGMAANDPDCKIDPKAFHCVVLKDHDTLKKNWTVTGILRLSVSWTIR
jgi:hypothetical protein